MTDTLTPNDFADAASTAIAAAMLASNQAEVLAEAGLFAILAAEDEGGLGLGREFAVPVLRAAGCAGLRFPLVEQILLARALSATPQGAALLAGEAVGTIALSGDLQSGIATHAGYAAQADYVLIASGAGAALFERGALQLTEDPSLDPEAPQGYFGTEGAQPIATLTAEAFAQLTADAEILYAALAVGCAEGALERTAAYVGTRVQFGRPLSAKQAVRHHMSRMKLATELAAAALSRALVPDEFGDTRDVGSALSLALSNGAFVVEKAIQLHGGMGFTWELPLHYPLRELRRLRSGLKPTRLQARRGLDFITAA